MTEEKKIPWFNQKVELQSVVDFTLWSTAGVVMLATMFASFDLVSWWLVFFAAVVPIFWTACVVGALLRVQYVRARTAGTWFQVKLRLFDWRKTWLFDFREELNR